MTIWTNDHQVFSFIIFSVSIYMMYTKYIFYLIISALLTLLKKSASFHSIAKIAKISISFRSSLEFSPTFRSTKSISPRRRTKKLFFTSLTFVFNRSSSFLRTMVTKSRTIFSFVTSRRNVFEFFLTYFAVSFYPLCASKFILTFSRAIFCRFKSVNRNVKFFFAPKTNYKFSSMRFIRHAIIQR